MSYHGRWEAGRHDGLGAGWDTIDLWGGRQGIPRRREEKMNYRPGGRGDR